MGTTGDEPLPSDTEFRLGQFTALMALGGRLDIESPAGGGTLIAATLPLAAGSELFAKDARLIPSTLTVGKAGRDRFGKVRDYGDRP